MNDLAFRILGPVEVLRAGKPDHGPGGTTRSLLAALLVSANRAVAATDLIRATWDGEDPAHPFSALQSTVFRLRRLLGADVVETVAGGYRLAARPETLDLLAFRQLTAAAARDVSDGAERVAAARLDEALALWQLPVLSNVTSAVLRRDVAPQLTDQFLDAHEERAQLYLRLGWHRPIAEELPGLVAMFPFREQLAGRLMVALYRRGRQSDALAVYEKLRHCLAGELGISPSPELQDLHLQILRADLPGSGEEQAVSSPVLLVNAAGSAGDASTGISAVPRQLPSDIADFTGRGRELALTRDILTDSGADGTAGSPPLCVIAGPGGAGKTALAIRAAHEVSPAFADGQLFADLQGAGPAPLEPGNVLSRFLLALGVEERVQPAGLDERAAMFRSLAADRRLLVVLDNAAGEGQIRPLIPGGAGCAVIVTARRRITGLSGGRLVELGMLADPDAVSLLGRIAGAGRISAEHADAAEIVRLTGGLPLALRIVGARLAARPHWEVSAMAVRLSDGRRRLSELRHGDLDVRASLTLSYQGLPEEARVLLRRIALLDSPDFPAWVSAALLGCTMRDGQETTDILLDARLLEPAGPGRANYARYRCHDLIRDFARELSAAADPQAGRAAAIGRVYGALLALSGHAHRQVYGGDYTILHGSAPRWLAPDMDPSQVVGSEPVAWLENERTLITAAIRQGSVLHLDEFCWDQAWIAVTLFEARGYLDDWKSAHERALAGARAAGNRRGEAAMLASLASRLIYQQDFSGARRLAEASARVFSEIGDRHGYAIAQQKIAVTYARNGHPDEALPRFRETMAAVRLAGDPFIELACLREMALLHADGEDFAAAEKCIDRMFAVGSEIGSDFARSYVLDMHGRLCLRRGQAGLAERAFENALQLVRRKGDLLGQLHARLGLAEALFDQGRLRSAEQQAIQIIDSAPRLRQEFLRARALLALGQIRVRQDRYGEAEHALQASIEIFRKCEIPLWLARARDVLSEVRAASC